MNSVHRMDVPINYMKNADEVLALYRTGINGRLDTHRSELKE